MQNAIRMLSDMCAKWDEMGKTSKICEERREISTSGLTCESITRSLEKLCDPRPEGIGDFQQNSGG